MHHQHLVRRIVLLLALCVLALAFVPPCAVPLDGRAQIAEATWFCAVARPVASRPSQSDAASARQVARSSRAADVSSLTAQGSYSPRFVVAPFAWGHGPCFDGGELYLDHCSLLC